MTHLKKWMARAILAFAEFEYDHVFNPVENGKREKNRNQLKNNQR